MKHKCNTNITQSPGRKIFMTYLRERESKPKSKYPDENKIKNRIKYKIEKKIWLISSQPTQTSLRRLQDVLKRSRRLTTKQDVVTMSGKRRRIYDVLKMSDLRRLEDVQFVTSGKRLIYDVFRTSDLRRLENVWFMTSWRRLIHDVLKTSVKRCLCSSVVATSIQRRKKRFFLILYCLEYSENFKCSSLS